MKNLTSLIQTPSRAEQAYLAIRESIIDGSLAPGEHLVQEDLAAALGVSRQPVQQAMALLKSDGLVVESGTRGLLVSGLDAQETAHRFQIRAALDQLAARKTAERAAASSDFARQLEQEGKALLDDGTASLATQEYRQAVEHDVAFHSLIYRASGNPLLLTTAEPHWIYIRRVMLAILLVAERGTTVWAQHSDILAALCKGRGEEAVALMTAHVFGAENALKAAFER